MTLSELNHRFLYVTDKELYGVSEYWSELEDVDNKLIGDCESYAITVKNNIDGFGSWDYYYCKLNGGGHCILVSPYRKDIIDNNTRKVVTMKEYLAMYKITDLRPYRWYELAWKFTQAKIYGIWFKVRK
jgi:predicted transglutaminase-like cysteine proteinase